MLSSAVALLPSLKGLLPAELEELARREGAPRYAGRQLLGWLYPRAAASFAEMTDLPAALRARLEGRYRLAEATVANERRDDDGTTKLLVALADGVAVESVIIPEPRRVTLCVSTQAGCARGCVFCATALMRLTRNLTAAEIVEQVVIARRRAPVSNVVFMGMGEPLDNYDNVRRAALLLTDPKGFALAARHVTLSTVGVVPGILRLAEDRVPVRLTVSLTAPDDALRSRLLPVNRAWPLAALSAACARYAELTRRRVTLAYVLLQGVNDAPRQAVALAAFARRLRAKVNLIPYNSTRDFTRPAEPAIARFHAELSARGVRALVRRERGGGIAAACGQLAVPGSRS